MSIKKLAVRGVLAVAGTVGVVGLVWAALPGGAAKDSAQMGVGFSVLSIGEIEATAHNPTNEELVANTITAVSGANFGSLGTIRVKTNSTSWDVKMTTQNGGRLASLDGVEMELSCDAADWLTGVVDSTTCKSVPSGPVPYLKNDAAADVRLGVAVGVAKSGKALGAGAQATIYPIFSATGTFVAPVIVPVADLTNSQIDIAMGFAEVSFAELLGAAYTSGIGGKFDLGIYGAEALATDLSGWETIEDDGFPLPKGNEQEMEEYFYVNVGINTSTNAIAGNKDGTYTETFYFDLVANF